MNSSAEITKEFSLAFVREKIEWKRNRPGRWDIFLFGPTMGKCPWCASGNIKGVRVTKAKWCYRLNDFPYECIGVEIECQETACAESNLRTGRDGNPTPTKRIVGSHDMQYVVTLPVHLRQQMPFVSWGKSRGVDKSLVLAMRLGQSAISVCEYTESEIRQKYQALKSRYEYMAQRAVTYQTYQSWKPFEPLKVGQDQLWISYTKLREAFLIDFKYHQDALDREMQTIRTHFSLGVDHQRKVVKSIRKDPRTHSDNGRQSLVIVNDRGMILNYVIVPSTHGEWYDQAVKEVINRHAPDETPKILWVDCGCCNCVVLPDVGGKKNAAVYGDHEVEKVLDGLHLVMRVTREMVKSHPRYYSLHSAISGCIYIDDPNDTAKLKKAQEQYEANQTLKLGRPFRLTDKQKRRDRMDYVRRIIAEGIRAAERILYVMKQAMLMDRECRQVWNNRGEDPDAWLNPSHWAAPLVTPRVKKAILDQVIHCRNGCINTVHRHATHVHLGRKNYRGDASIQLEAYASTQGTSKCETVHSVMARTFNELNNLRPEMFDARAMWKLAHFNRNKLRKDGHTAIPNGLSAMEWDGVLVSENKVSKDFLFGYRYYEKVLQDKSVEIYNEVATSHRSMSREERQIFDECQEIKDKARPPDDMAAVLVSDGGEGEQGEQGDQEEEEDDEEEVVDGDQSWKTPEIKELMSRLRVIPSSKTTGTDLDALIESIEEIATPTATTTIGAPTLAAAATVATPTATTIGASTLAAATVAAPAPSPAHAANTSTASTAAVGPAAPPTSRKVHEKQGVDFHKRRARAKDNSHFYPTDNDDMKKVFVEQCFVPIYATCAGGQMREMHYQDVYRKYLSLYVEEQQKVTGLPPEEAAELCKKLLYIQYKHCKDYCIKLKGIALETLQKGLMNEQCAAAVAEIRNVVAMGQASSEVNRSVVVARADITTQADSARMPQRTVDTGVDPRVSHTSVGPRAEAPPKTNKRKTQPPFTDQEYKDSYEGGLQERRKRALEGRKRVAEREGKKRKPVNKSFEGVPGFIECGVCFDWIKRKKKPSCYSENGCHIFYHKKIRYCHYADADRVKLEFREQFAVSQKKAKQAWMERQKIVGAD